MSTVQRESVTWLWHHRVPLGKITLIDGDPGLGKSLITTDLAARITRGAPMPDGSSGLQGGVVLISLEDGLGDTLRPRLEIAGADLERVVSLATVPAEEGRERAISLPGDTGLIIDEVRATQAVLVVIDPIMAALGKGIDSHKDQDVRRVLAPLALAADKYGFAVLIVRHLNKASSGGNPIYRGGGSIAFVGAARAAMVVAEDPDDKNRRVVASINSNLAPTPPSLAFHIEEVDSVPRIVWDGTSDHRAEALLAPTSAEEHGQRAAAKAFLLEVLADGPVASEKVITQGEAMDIKRRTVWRAKSDLGVIARKSGFAGGWTWELPNRSTG